MLKKVASYLLVFLVFALTILGLLAIWDLIEVEHVIQRILTSLFVIFVSAVVVLFIFGVVLKDSSNK